MKETEEEDEEKVVESEGTENALSASLEECSNVYVAGYLAKKVLSRIRVHGL